MISKKPYYAAFVTVAPAIWAKLALNKEYPKNELYQNLTRLFRTKTAKHSPVSEFRFIKVHVAYFLFYYKYYFRAIRVRFCGPEKKSQNRSCNRMFHDELVPTHCQKVCFIIHASEGGPTASRQRGHCVHKTIRVRAIQRFKVHRLKARKGVCARTFAVQ